MASRFLTLLLNPLLIKPPKTNLFFSSHSSSSKTFSVSSKMASSTTTSHPKKVLFAIAHGNEPMESVTIIDVLRRAGAEVTVASVENEIVLEMGFKIKLVGDAYITAFTHSNFDLITLPGGIKGCESLRDCKVLENLVKEQIEKERLLAAICAAPAVTLEPWKVLKEKESTCFPGLKHKLSPEVNYVESRVHHHGQLVTSQAPGTGMEFAVALVQKLYGKEKCDEVTKQLVLRPHYGKEYEFTEFNPVSWTFNGTEPQVLVPIVNDIDAIEASIITDILRRGGANVIVASLENKLEIVASQDVKIVADVLLAELTEQSFDLIVLPGGLHGAQALGKSEKLIDLLKQQAKSEKPYGAISYSPAIVLKPHGLLEEKYAIGSPNTYDELSDKSEDKIRVLIDGNLITSRGPGTSMEFALVMVQKFFGREEAMKLAKRILFVDPDPKLA